jgi:hypothetical protein
MQLPWVVVMKVLALNTVGKLNMTNIPLLERTMQETVTQHAVIEVAAMDLNVEHLVMRKEVLSIVICARINGIVIIALIISQSVELFVGNIAKVA